MYSITLFAYGWPELWLWGSEGQASREQHLPSQSTVRVINCTPVCPLTDTKLTSAAVNHCPSSYLWCHNAVENTELWLAGRYLCFFGKINPGLVAPVWQRMLLWLHANKIKRYQPDRQQDFLWIWYNYFNTFLYLTSYDTHWLTVNKWNKTFTRSTNWSVYQHKQSFILLKWWTCKQWMRYGRKRGYRIIICFCLQTIFSSVKHGQVCLDRWAVLCGSWWLKNNTWRKILYSVTHPNWAWSLLSWQVIRPRSWLSFLVSGGPGILGPL